MDLLADHVAPGCLSGSVLIINFTAAPSSRPGLIGIWIGVCKYSSQSSGFCDFQEQRANVKQSCQPQS